MRHTDTAVNTAWGYAYRHKQSVNTEANAYLTLISSARVRIDKRRLSKLTANLTGSLLSRELIN
jgi:hypothetical protein